MDELQRLQRLARLHQTKPQPLRSAFVNAGPEHMPEGLASHLDHLRRLALRGEKDES